jgi:glycosyltransferase involved in cell wall biosynthesis
MTRQPLRRRLKALFWEHSWRWRNPLRRLRRTASIGAHRVRTVLGRQRVPRIVTDPVEPTEPLPIPLIALAPATDCDRSSLRRFLSQQTETSVTGDTGLGAPLLYMPGGEDLEELPATHLESMVMAAAAEDLDQAVAGWAAPAKGRFGPSGPVYGRPATARSTHLLLRQPQASRQTPTATVGRTVSHICADSPRLRSNPILAPAELAGSNLIRGDLRRGAVVRRPVRSIHDALAAVPVEHGARTVLFLLPYLAVGGAERLLYDLLWGLGDRCRSLVVTLEPHRAALGQTLDVCRDLTPHVYSLGDWLPREAHLEAIRHLIRRWSVATLVSWNGTVAFFDHAAEFKRWYPELRILSQLFNHHGAWIDRTTPTLIDAVDLHVAVNGRIAEALEREWAVPRSRIATIHHAVEVPPELPGTDVERRRRARRRQLGIPEEAVVVGTFARMHPQKRPLDVVRLAERMAGYNVHFLLVGGGPMDDAVDRELSRRPHPNVTRLPLRHDTDELLDAVDICMLPSRYEGLPVFLLEGMARSIPCVATAVGDVPMLLAEGGGVVSGKPGDLAALERAVRTLMDDRRRAEEGARARARVVERFGVDRMVAEYESAIFNHAPLSSS